MRVVLVLIVWAFCQGGVAAGQTADELFAGGSLLDIRLTMSDRDWATLKANFLTNTYFACDVRVTVGGQEAVVRNAGVRSRGTGSRSGVKQALKIDIERYVKDQRFFGLRSLILRNFLQDASMVHEYVTFELQRRLGLSVPRVRFARLFVNNIYSGLYELVEDVDEEFLDRAFGEHGGYLYEFAWTYPYFFEYLAPNLSAYEALWEPATRDSESQVALYGPFEELSRLLDAAGSGPFPDAALRLADVRQILRLVAADNFMADWDGMLGYAGFNNIYFYRPEGGPGVIIPWDKDNTFHAVDYSAFEGTGQNLLVSRALRDPRLAPST